MHSNIANTRTTHCHAHASRLAPSSRCAASFCENWVCLSWGLVLGPPQAATGKFLSRSESIPLNSSSYLSDKRNFCLLLFLPLGGSYKPACNLQSYVSKIPMQWNVGCSFNLACCSLGISWNILEYQVGARSAVGVSVCDGAQPRCHTRWSKSCTFGVLSSLAADRASLESVLALGPSWPWDLHIDRTDASYDIWLLLSKQNYLWDQTTSSSQSVHPDPRNAWMHGQSQFLVALTGRNNFVQKTSPLKFAPRRWELHSVGCPAYPPTKWYGDTYKMVAPMGVAAYKMVAPGYPTCPPTSSILG